MTIRTRPIFNDFTRGELDPGLEGQVGLDGYYKSVHLLENLICKPQGSLINRGGFHFVTEVRESSTLLNYRLIPFQYAELQNYVILAEHETFWFFMDCGQIMNPEKVTNGTFSFDTGWTKGANWTISEGKAHKSAGAQNNLSQDIGAIASEKYKIVFTIDSISGGSLTASIGGVSGTARNAAGTYTEYITATGTEDLIFIPNAAEVICQIDNISVIKVNSALDECYELESPYSYDELPDIWWAQGDINLYLIHPDKIPKIMTRTDHDEWTIDDIDFIDGPYMDENTDIKLTPDDTTGDTFITADDNLFLPGHVGALWKIRHGENYGYCKITSIDEEDPTTIANVTVLKDFASTDPSDGQSEGAWSGVNGYPRAICFDEGRLLFASTYEQPNTIWASRTRRFNDMTMGDLDDDAYSFTVSEINIIRWIEKARFLCMGALNGEATAESNDILTATNPPTIKSQTTHGSAEVKPIRVGKAIIFCQKAQTKLREFVYNYADDAYSAPDLTILSSHITQNGILRIAYQQEPNPIIWAIISGGELAGCTYDRSVNAIGWHRHPTDGEIIDIITIPYQNKDQLWAIIRREIDIEYRYYVEYLDDDICVDSGLTYSGEPETDFNAFHLRGKTIKIIGDGAVYPDQTVPIDGDFVIDPAASEVYAGLEFTPKLITNRPEVNIGGTAQGLQQAWNRIIVRVLDTMGLKVNGMIIAARSTEDLMDGAPEPYTGDFNVENLGWDNEGRIEIEQTLALPVHILCITGELNIGTE